MQIYRKVSNQLEFEKDIWQIFIKNMCYAKNTFDTANSNNSLKYNGLKN